MRFYTRAENDARREAAKEFRLVFELVLAGAPIDFYKVNFGSLLGWIAQELFTANGEDEYGYWESQTEFGINNISVQVLDAKELEFQAGMIWMGEYEETENLRMRVLDQGTNKQDLWITAWLGNEKKEGNLCAAFGIIEDGVDDEI